MTSKFNKSAIEGSLANHNDAKIEHDLRLRHIPALFLILGVVLLFYLLYTLYTPFLTVLILAVILSVGFYPLYKRFLTWFGSRRRITSLIMCLLAILVFILPIVFLITLLATEAVSTYTWITTKIQEGALDKWLSLEPGGPLAYLKENILPSLHLTPEDLKRGVAEVAQNVTTFLVTQSANLVASASTLVIHFLVMLLAMYYFFKDGENMVARLIDLSPLPSKYETQIMGKLREMMGAIVYGVFLTAIVQGALGGIGFAIAGIENPVFWGAAISFFSFVPFVGTALIWLPAALILLFTGHVPAGIFLMIYGAALISSIDNFIKPFFIGGKAKTHPLWTFLSVVGGLFVFGLKGALFGPLILALFMTFIHIYELEYHSVLKGHEPHPVGPGGT